MKFSVLWEADDTKFGLIDCADRNLKVTKNGIRSIRLHLSVSDMADTGQREMVSERVPAADQHKAAEVMPAPTKKAKPAVPLFSANGTSSKPPTSGESLPKPGASQSQPASIVVAAIVWQQPLTCTLHPVQMLPGQRLQLRLPRRRSGQPTSRLHSANASSMMQRHR